MDKQKICELLERAIVYATHTKDDLIKDRKFIKSKKLLVKVIDEIDCYIHTCQQIINDNSTTK
jgi:hypothetical protein